VAQRHGLSFLNGTPNMGCKAFLEMGLQQDMVDACSRSLFKNMLVGIAGNEDDWRVDVAVPQAAGKVDAAHGWHLVVDHKAIDFTRYDPIQQCGAAPKRPNGEAVRLKQKSQRPKDVRIVINDVDNGCRG